MPNHTAERSCNFMFILYPDCLEHQNLMKYLSQMSNIFEWVRILHDKDIASDVSGECLATLKKPHYHYLIHYKTLKTTKSVQSFFHVWLDHVELCHDLQSSLLYFLHMTPDCYAKNKHKYSADLLEGSSRLISSILQNSNLLQLRESLDLLESCNGRIVDVIRTVSDSSPVYGQVMLKTIQSYQGLFVAASKQEFELSRITENNFN